MGNNQLLDYSSEKKVKFKHHSQYRTALLGTLYPRNSTTGAVENNAGDLGDSTTYWQNAFIRNLTLDGTLFDPNTFGTDSSAYSIRSGATRSDSSQPLFLQANGAAATFQLLAATTNLKLTIAGAEVTYSTDITSGTLTTAPSSNNTCLVNDTNMSDQEETKYIKTIPIDTIGTEISSLNGTLAAFKTDEYFIAYVDSTNNILEVVERGGWFNSSNTPVARATLANNDTITLMQLVYVYGEDSGTTIAVGYTQPVYSATEPSSPASGDYWFDLDNQVWKVYNGSSYGEVSRHLIGLAIVDATNCVATKCFDLSKSFSDLNTVRCRKQSDTVVESKFSQGFINVYGTTLGFRQQELTFDIASDLESGVSEANSTWYYCYITDTGDLKISDERPNWKTNLRGLYHPYHSWRWVASVYNDSSGDLEEVDNKWYDGIEIIDTDNDGYWTVPDWVDELDIEVVGAGGGGGGQNGTSGQGGGGGAFCKGLYQPTASNYFLTVGAGGAAGSAIAVGGDGGTSSFDSIISCGGGYGGFNGATGSSSFDNGYGNITVTTDSAVQITHSCPGGNTNDLSTPYSNSQGGASFYAPIDYAPNKVAFGIGSEAKEGYAPGAGGGGRDGGAGNGAAGRDGRIIIRYRGIK